MSKERTFDPRLAEPFGAEGTDDIGGPVLTFRRMTPPPGTNAFSSVRNEGGTEQLCARCRERPRQDGKFCFGCADIQNSLSRIAEEANAPQKPSAEPFLNAANLRRQTPEGLTPSPSELNRPAVMQTGSLFDELLEEVKQIQEPVAPQVTASPEDYESLFLSDDHPDSRGVGGGFVDKGPPPMLAEAARPANALMGGMSGDMLSPQAEDSAGPVEGVAAALRHSPERPLARDLPVHRASPSQYIRSGSDEPDSLASDRMPKRSTTRPPKAVAPTKPLSEGQVQDVDALLLDLIQVGEKPPPPPKSPLRILFWGMLLIALGCGAALVLYYLR